MKFKGEGRRGGELLNGKDLSNRSGGRTWSGGMDGLPWQWWRWWWWWLWWGLD